MKKQNMIILAAFLIMVSRQATAEINPQDHQQVAQVKAALAVLIQARVLLRDQNTNELRIRSKVLDQLRTQGIVDTSGAQAGSFCM